MKRNRIGYGALAVVCLLIGAMAGITNGFATGNHHKAHSAQSNNESQRQGRPGPGGPGGPPPIHSVSVVPNREGTGFDTITLDSGKVQSVSGQQLTITEGTKTLTYRTVTLTISGSATVQRDGKSAQLSELQQGDHVIVCEDSNGTTMVNAADSSFRPQGHPGPGGPPPGGPGGPGGPGAPGHNGPQGEGSGS